MNLRFIHFLSIPFIIFFTNYFNIYIKKIFNKNTKQKKELIILRGVPGVGKDRFISEYQQKKSIGSYYIISTNNYLLESYTPENIEKNRVKCTRDLLKLVNLDVDTIYISDTHYKRWHYINYKFIANLYNYYVKIYDFNCPDTYHLQYFNSRSKKTMNYSKKVFNEYEPDITSIYIEPYIEKLKGDSLPYPKKTKEELDNELDNIFSNKDIIENKSVNSITYYSKADFISDEEHIKNYFQLLYLEYF